MEVILENLFVDIGVQGVKIILIMTMARFSYYCSGFLLCYSYQDLKNIQLLQQQMFILLL